MISLSFFAWGLVSRHRLCEHSKYKYNALALTRVFALLPMAESKRFDFVELGRSFPLLSNYDALVHI